MFENLPRTNIARIIRNELTQLEVETERYETIQKRLIVMNPFLYG